ncbi:VWA domain-containing protein [Candidatus Actinomarina sp.]|nr:VWA domain-containing protein [Candidatus Actinomarina sp.]
MNLTTTELANFSEFCKENNYYIPVESTESFLRYRILKKIDSLEDNLKYLFYLLPKDRESQNTLKSLIYRYFHYSLEESEDNTFYMIEEYYKDNGNLFETLQEINLGNLSKVKKITNDLINNAIEVDFTRPVSDLYWLNQIKKSEKYKTFFNMFDLLDISNFSKLTNELNKRNMERLLDTSILEKIREERNKQKAAYEPSELEPRTELNETDFLFTNQQERQQLLEQTYQLGNKLAVKYKRFIKESNKGRLFFRRTIRKSLETGGAIQNIILKPKLRKKPKLTIVCDISGSMALNSLFGVTLLYGMINKFSSIKAYVFIDGITEITKALRSIKKNEIESIFSRWNEFVKSDGHSDYQKSFEELIELDETKNGTLIVIGDARNNYRNISQELISNLAEKYNKIFWINPEQKKYWNTGDSQMNKFEVINLRTVEVRNYKQLKKFIQELDFKKVLA